MSRRRCRGRVFGLTGLMWVALIASAPALTAQGSLESRDRSEVGRLAASCSSGGSPLLAGGCAEAALAAASILEGVGLLTSAGGALPVSPSTAGFRIDGTPRVVVDAGLNLARIRHLDLAATPGSLAETHSTLLAGRLTTTVGLFEGFRPVATVGGVGAVDGVATLRIVRLPDGPGDHSRTAVAWGAGARIGVVRESFSLPGITLTAMHHRVGSIRNGEMPDGGSQILLNPRITSARLEVGKDLLALGVTAGFGVDRVGGRARIRALGGPTQGGMGEVGEASRDDLMRNRPSFFAGLNYTWLVTQVAGEVTWSPGRDVQDDLLPLDVFPLDRGQVQGTLTFRLIY